MSLQYQVRAAFKWPGDDFWGDDVSGDMFGVDILGWVLFCCIFLIFNLVINPLHFKLFHVGCLFSRIFREVRSVYSCFLQDRLLWHKDEKGLCCLFRGSFYKFGKMYLPTNSQMCFHLACHRIWKMTFETLGIKDVLFPMLAKIFVSRDPCIWCLAGWRSLWAKLSGR